MPFNDIFRLRLYQRLHGGQVVNVMHFVQEDPLPTVGAQQLANDFGTNMLTALRNRASNELRFETVEVQSLVPFSGGVSVYTFPANTVGAVGTPVTSGTLAEVMTIYTSRGGKRGRGRVYWAGTATAGTGASSGGVWSSGQTAITVALATAIANRYMAPTGGLQWKLGVWSRVIAGPNPPWPTDAFVRATGLTVRSTMRTQRRRQVGVGR